MKKEAAIIICNFNKKEDVLQCIDSVFNLSFKDYDLYVVDNASSDGSAEAIEAAYGNRVILIKNEENTGGSGGFNTGMREALKKEYRYLYLLDNDIILHENALTELYNYLEGHQDVGIAGSLLYSMDHPTEIQELGADIDWDNFTIKPNFKGNIDLGVPIELECDYVPACSLLVRTEAIKKVGLMEETNFIYWDDIEWGHRMKLHGYKVVACSGSKVWHKMGAARKVNTFNTYYFWRNRVHFFVKYSDINHIRQFIDCIFYETVQAIYSCNYTGKYNSARTIVMAIEDALANIRGKAAAGRVFDLETVENRFENLLANSSKVILIDNENLKIVRDIATRIRTVNESTELIIAGKFHQVTYLRPQFPGLKIIQYQAAFEYKDGLICQSCAHIFNLADEFDERVNAYIDGYFNIIVFKEDRKYAKNFQHTYTLFKNIYYPIFFEKILRLREHVAQPYKEVL